MKLDRPSRGLSRGALSSSKSEHVKLLPFMLPDVEVAVRLQAIDLRISDLQKEIAALPKYVAEIEKKLSAHERRLEKDRAALAANQKERKRLDGEIQIFEAKITKLRSDAGGEDQRAVSGFPKRN